jgi:hypothetical protein
LNSVDILVSLLEFFLVSKVLLGLFKFLHFFVQVLLGTLNQTSRFFFFSLKSLDLLKSCSVRHQWFGSHELAELLVLHEILTVFVNVASEEVAHKTVLSGASSALNSIGRFVSDHLVGLGHVLEGNTEEGQVAEGGSGGRVTSCQQEFVPESISFFALLS